MLESVEKPCRAGILGRSPLYGRVEEGGGAEPLEGELMDGDSKD